ncbi:MAG: hypothetical protein ABSC95_25245, partial [Acetobacteraceae bacterium]
MFGIDVVVIGRNGRFHAGSPAGAQYTDPISLTLDAARLDLSCVKRGRGLRGRGFLHPELRRHPFAHDE